jgi:2-haloacid dehalogenase
MMAIRPSAVAFDVVETLMALQPLGGRLEEVGRPASLLPGWFSRLLLYGVGLSAAGDYVPFGEAAAEALRAVCGYQISGAGVAHVLAGFGDLPAQPDAEPAMARLAGAGVRMMCLTNGSADVTSAFLARTGLDRYITSSGWPPRRRCRAGSRRPACTITRWTSLACPRSGWRWWRCTPGTATGPSGPG